MPRNPASAAARPQSSTSVSPARRKTLAVVALAAAGLAGTAAWAQDGAYPTRPVTLVVSAAAGGTTDLAARMISEPLSKALGQPVVVDNRPGGSGGIAAQTVARAKPDGYTLMVQYSGYQVISPLLMKNAWDPVKDFAPVANILSAPQVLVVRPSLPVKTLKELVAYAKANPNKLNYASSGNGSLQHVSTELLNQMAGIQITHVPYKGTGPAMTDLLGGSVDLTITTPPPLMGHIAGGKLRPLVVTSKQRLPSLKDVPSAPEAGYPDLDVSSWFAMYAPAGTPKPIIDKLAGEIDRIMQTEAFRKKAEELGAEAKFMGPAQLATYQRNELARWAKVIKAADIHAE
ncbi:MULTISPECIES: Bug family tripartite tricarboxylate transporter substrate binding protein [unclassified Cupriavidus]|uniref:Bug family tripartite tricarboxylate transporter substrate binding protein n=1 Tax=Cupriavidus TaxID=106589 RepID=UPI00226FBA2D|nr:MULTISPECIES: tripartite tricarboxylate transporter substrate binding protein [unclassified Cupriavidus]MCY0855733.1 tripartite tricarboxylate transporter substrate binding protein [Cupriavidus sp. D39]MDW3680750.1 tripartite tricarboxylate transporter substrate binding protein [Cupriavidus sp. CV2]